MKKAIGGLAVLLLILATPALFLTGCGSSGGSSSSDDSSSSGGDTSSGGTSTSGGTDTVEPKTNGSESESGTNGTSHYTGRDCVSCHESQESNKRYVYAGTVYGDAAGTSTITGAVVVITESGGSALYVTTDKSGNFYTTRGTRGSSYNATIQGNTVGMVSTASYGGCANCHDGTMYPRVYIN